MISENIYKYLILFATFLLPFSFIPLVFEITQQKITSNIPYATLISLMIVFLIYIFHSLNKRDYIHLFFYVIALICISLILFLKRKYDNNNITIEKTVNTKILMNNIS